MHTTVFQSCLGRWCSLISQTCMGHFRNCQCGFGAKLDTGQPRLHMWIQRMWIWHMRLGSSQYRAQASWCVCCAYTQHDGWCMTHESRQAHLMCKFGGCTSWTSWCTFSVQVLRCMDYSDVNTTCQMQRAEGCMAWFSLIGWFGTDGSQTPLFLG